MFFWTPYTFVRIVVFFIAGILLGIYQPDLIPERIILFAFGFLFLSFFVLMFTRWKNQYAGYVGLSILILGGYLNTVFKTDSRNSSHIININRPIHFYKVVITDHAEGKEKSWKTEAKILSYFDGIDWYTASGNLLLYFSKEDFAYPFSYGDVLLIKGKPSELRGPANPGEFDYKRFLSFRKIYNQHFIREDNVQFLENDPPSILIEYSIRARVWAEQVLAKYIIGDQERAVALALILGVKDGLDNDLVQAYSSSGAMHVLAVSGLHVGIIYLIFMFLFRPLKSVTYGHWILAILSITTLWAYAFITGLSPSVLRAVTMFLFLALARPLNYYTNIFNTLAVSAFCLLMWEPFLIMSVGFQLSYMAVLGIVYLQPKLYQLWIPAGWIWDKIWQITCVSIAAQLATFTLGILYFHQFPVYFLVSNLFVIPGALLSLCLGLLLLAISFVNPVAQLVGTLLERLLWILNYLVFSVEQLPFSLIQNIYITTTQSWLLLGLVFSLVLVLQYRKFVFIKLYVVCGLVFAFIQWQHHFGETSHPKLVIYSISGHNAMEWVNKGKSYFFADSILINDRERIRFHIRPNRLLNGVHATKINATEFSRIGDGYTLYNWNNIKLIQITSEKFSLPDGLEVDYLVLSNNSVKYFNRMPAIGYKTLIIDSSYSTFSAKRIKEAAILSGVHAYSVGDEGAFLTKL